MLVKDVNTIKKWLSTRKFEAMPSKGKKITQLVFKRGKITCCVSKVKNYILTITLWLGSRGQYYSAMMPLPCQHKYLDTLIILANKWFVEMEKVLYAEYTPERIEKWFEARKFVEDNESSYLAIYDRVFKRGNFLCFIPDENLLQQILIQAHGASIRISHRTPYSFLDTILKFLVKWRKGE